MADVNINKFRASVVRDGSKPASPGFIVSEGQDPVDPAGNGQNHLPVTIATAATGLSITDSQVLGGAGTVGQYIRGDGSLADFPQASGGGSSVSYYLNGSISQGTIGGVAYKELNKVPILGAGTDFTINANGYIASFLTDAGDPNLLEIPGGNWNFETYFSASSSGGTPTFYVELYKYDGTTFTLIASSSSSPELIAFGTNLNPYFSTLAVPTTTLALTDRLAVRFYVNHSGRTITLHTENNHLCQVVTTFTTGLTSLNGLTAQVQNLAVGTSGTDFNIASATATHTFNLPTASATNRGALSSADWTIFNNKQNALTNPVTGTGTTNYLPKFTGASTIGNSNLSDDGSNLIIDSRNFNFGNTGFGVYLSRSGLGPRASLTTRSNINWVDIANSSDWSGVTLAASGGNVLIGTTSDNGSGARLQNNGALTTNTTTVTNGTRSWIINPSGASIQEEFSGVVEGKIDPSSGGNSWLGATSGTTGAGAKHYFSSTGAATFASTVSTSNEFYVSGTGQNAFKINSTGTYYGMIQNTAADKWSLAYGVNGAGNTALGTSVLTWTGSGNVGIGTASPSSLLSVSKSSNSGSGSVFPRLQVENTLATQGNGSSTFNFADIRIATGNGSAEMYLASSFASGTWEPQGLISVATNHPMIFRTNNTERMRITSSGNVGIGTASPSVISGYSVLSLNNITNSGLLDIQGNGTSFGYIYSSTSNNNLILQAIGTSNTGNIVILTASTERFRVTGTDGFVRLSTNSGGIQFNGDTSSANALDDYEEGSFSPTIFGSSTAGTVTYGARNGLYTKIGRAVSFNIYVDWSAGTGSGNLRLSGLPFTASATGVYPAVAIGEISNIALSANTIATARVQISTNEIWFGQAVVGGGGNSSVAYDGAGYIVLSGTYYV